MFSIRKSHNYFQLIFSKADKSRSKRNSTHWVRQLKFSKYKQFWRTARDYLLKPEYRSSNTNWIFNLRIEFLPGYSINIYPLFQNRERLFLDLTWRTQKIIIELVSKGITPALFENAIENHHNKLKLNSLWKNIQSVLKHYPNLAPNMIEFSNHNYYINELFAQKANTSAGSNLPTNAKTQLQALVNGRMTTSAHMQTALNNFNNQQLDRKWQEFDDNLSPYSDFLPAALAINKKIYFFNALWPKLSTPYYGSGFTGNARSQLQELVNDQITWDQIKFAFEQFNNEKLNNLWKVIQPILNNYSNLIPNFIQFNNQSYEISQLFTEKANTGSGSNLPTNAKAQLQILVNAQMTTGSQMTTALTNANNEFLDDKWNKLRNYLITYPGFQFDLVRIVSTDYTLTALWTKVSTTDVGSTFKNNPLNQLQKLVNKKITWEQIKDRLNVLNNQKLDTLWTALKKQNGLGGYTGFNPGNQKIDIANKKYRVNLLIDHKKLDTAGRALNDPIKVQLQVLVNNKVTASMLRTVLDNANNKKLDALWSDLKNKLFKYSGFKSNSIKIGSTTYTLADLWNKLSTYNDGSAFRDNALNQLQALVNNKITWDQIKTEIDKLNKQKLDLLWSIIQSHLSAYPNLTPDSTTFNKKNHNINQLFVQKINIAKGSTLPTDAKSQLQSLVNSGMTTLDQMKIALTNANNKFLHDKWNELKTEFSTYSGFKSNSVQIGSKIYILTNLWTKSTDPSNPAGYTFTTNARSQLQALVNNKITWDQIKTELDKLKNQKLDTLWTALKKATNLGGYTGFNPGNQKINLNNKQYQVNLLIDHKKLDTSGSTLNDPIKAQLQVLVNNKVTASMLRAALDTTNNKELDYYWFELENKLFKYSGFPFDSVEIGSKTYTLTDLWTKVSTTYYGSDFKNNAKVQLQTLVNNNITWDQIKTELDKLNNQKLNNFWTTIQPFLKHYQNLLPPSIKFGSISYDVNQLFVQKPNLAGSVLPDNAKTQLQTLVNAGMSTGLQMTTALTNANNKFLDDKWNELKTEFSTYSGFQSDSVKIGSTIYTLTALWNKISTTDIGSDFKDTALIQLQTLVNEKITWNQIKTELEKLNNQKLDDLWNAIQPLLNSYHKFEPNSIAYGSESNLAINTLFDEKTNTGPGSKLPILAKTQLQTLVNAGMTTGPQMTTALVNANTVLLTTLWDTIQDELQNYPGIVFNTPITIPNKGSFTINHLLDQKDDNFSDLSPEAIAQLQALLDKGVTNDELGTALTSRNNIFLNDFWVVIQPHLSSYPNFAPDSITFKGKNYNIDQLFAKKDHDQHRGSKISNTGTPNARNQLQTLVNAGMTTLEQMKIALNTANNKFLDNKWTELKGEFSTYSNFKSDSVTISTKTYTLTALWNKVSTDDVGSAFRNNALIQLQALVNKQINWDQIKTELDKLNNQKLDNLWSAIQPLLSTYPNLAPDAIPFNNQNYNIDQLFGQKTNTNAGSILPVGAKVQLQTLLNAQMTTLEQMQDALLDANNKFLDDKWNELKNEFATYSGFKSDSVTISGKTYTLTDLWTKSTTDENGSAFINNARSQLQALVNNKITWNQIKTELDKLNNQKLNNFWTTIQPLLKRYPNLPPPSIQFGSTSYDVNQLFVQKTNPVVSTFDGEAKKQLQSLVNAGMTTGPQVQTALNTANNKFLDDKSTELKNKLFTYSGFQFDKVTINKKVYIFTDFWNKVATATSSSTLSTNAKTQLQTLVDDQITWDQIKTELEKLNNQKLNAFWTEVKEVLKKNDDYHLGKKQIIIKNKVYAFEMFDIQTKPIQLQDSSFADLADDSKAQLQVLVNEGVTAKDIDTYLIKAKKAENNNQKKQKEKKLTGAKSPKTLEIKTKKTTNQKLVIYLGIVGGVVFFLVIVLVFIYWFVQRKKQKKNDGDGWNTIKKLMMFLQ